MFHNYISGLISLDFDIAFLTHRFNHFNDRLSDGGVADAKHCFGFYVVEGEVVGIESCLSWYYELENFEEGPELLFEIAMQDLDSAEFDLILKLVADEVVYNLAAEAVGALADQYPLMVQELRGSSERIDVCLCAITDVNHRNPGREGHISKIFMVMVVKELFKLRYITLYMFIYGRSNQKTRMYHNNLGFAPIFQNAFFLVALAQIIAVHIFVNYVGVHISTSYAGEIGLGIFAELFILFSVPFLLLGVVLAHYVDIAARDDELLDLVVITRVENVLCPLQGLGIPIPHLIRSCMFLRQLRHPRIHRMYHIFAPTKGPFDVLSIR